MTLINWLLKPKMYTNTFFFNFILYENTIWDIFLYFERLGHMHENKIFFLFFHIYFLQRFRETKYCNTGFVFL